MTTLISIPVGTEVTFTPDAESEYDLPGDVEGKFYITSAVLVEPGYVEYAVNEQDGFAVDDLDVVASPTEDSLNLDFSELVTNEDGDDEEGEDEGEDSVYGEEDEDGEEEAEDEEGSEPL